MQDQPNFLTMDLEIGGFRFKANTVNDILSNIVHHLHVDVTDCGIKVSLGTWTLARSDSRVACAVWDTMRSFHRVFLIDPNTRWLETAVEYQIASHVDRQAA